MAVNLFHFRNEITWVVLPCTNFLIQTTSLFAHGETYNYPGLESPQKNLGQKEGSRKQKYKANHDSQHMRHAHEPLIPLTIRFYCRNLNIQERDGVRGNALNWFQSYSSGRFQYVTVNGHRPDFLPITFCVLQGSVLGPLLFLIYVNDLPSVSKVFEILFVVYDPSIYFDSND